jgi:predicted transcriptional regulator
MGIEETLESFSFPIGQDTNLNKEIIKKLFDLDTTKPKELNLKTELSDTELKIITKLELINETFKMPKLKNLIEEFKQLRVSLKRQGRNELISALKFEQDEKRQDRINSVKRALGIDR